MRFAAAQLALKEESFASLYGLAILSRSRRHLGTASGSGRPLDRTPIGEGIVFRKTLGRAATAECS
jgi:hypothetical protein